MNYDVNATNRFSPDPNRTRWTLVEKALSPDHRKSQNALDELCGLYRPTVYNYFRAKGRNHEEAEDLTQEFFKNAIHRELFHKADPVRGRLRDLLYQTAYHLWIKDYHQRTAQKRGGGKVPDPLDAKDADGLPMIQEPAHDLTPDRVWMRGWSMDMVRHAFEELEAQYESQGKVDIYRQLRPLMGFTDLPDASYVEISARTGISKNTLRTHMFQLKATWKDLLWHQVSLTLKDPTVENIQDELRELRDYLTQ